MVMVCIFFHHEFITVKLRYPFFPPGAPQQIDMGMGAVILISY
jgi:hypothetical protein